MTATAKTVQRSGLPPRRVFVRDLEVMASIGIFEVEHRYEQRVLISIDLDVADTYDGTSERIADVLDYSIVVRDTEALVQSGHFKLLETLAERIAGLCLADRRVVGVIVRVEKPDIISNCRTVGVEIHRTPANAGMQRELSDDARAKF